MVCGNCGHEYKIKEGIANFLLPSHLGELAILLLEIWLFLEGFRSTFVGLCGRV